MITDPSRSVKSLSRIERNAGLSRMSLPLPARDPIDRRTLTPRQREIASLVRDARTNPEIAQALEVSAAAVKRELTLIYLKLNVRDRVALAVHWDREHPSPKRPCC